MFSEKFQSPIIVIIVIIVIIIIIIIILCINHGHSEGDGSEKYNNTKNILILNSYHQGYKWTDDEINGIITSLEPLSGITDFYIEYMGTKWNYDNQYFQQLIKLYKYKFQSIPFDLIFATDDDAFNFLKLYRDEIFGNVPVVFSGINWISSERIKGLNNFTGVNEDVDIALNIDLILKLHPSTRNIYVIIDSTTTGLAVVKKFNEIIPLYINRINIHLLFNYKMSDLLNKLSVLENDSIVFITVFQQDKTGHFYEYKDSCGMISQHSRSPVYGLWDFNLGYGMAGGNLASGYSQGETAGKIGMRILNGEPADSIPIIMNSPNYYMFDYLQLDKHKISLSALPAGSILVNKPSPFYSINKRVFQAILLIFTVFAAAIIALIMNIRKRNSAEKALRNSEEKYRSLVNNLNVGVFRSMSDKEGKLIQANPAMMKIFGYDSYEEFLGISIVNLYRDQAERRKFIDALVKYGSLHDLELKMVKKDGTPIWVSISASSEIHSAEDRIYRVDGIVEDITEKKIIEQELKYAQKMETIGTLASGLVHDFNNSLGGLIGILSIIDHKLNAGINIPEKKLKHFITIMQESINKGAVMVQRLLTLARKRDEEHYPADLNGIVRHVVELLFNYIDKSINIKTEYIDDKAIVLADPAQIEQSLLNLCINAGHAMTVMRNDRDLWGGTLSISIEKIFADKYLCETHHNAEEKDYWIISISDTGIGMTPEIMSRIFDPFYTTKDEGIGTGLGLAIVNSAIKDHGGFIDVYSEYGTGTTFKLYIPVSSEKPEAAAESSTAEIPYGTGLILVVDDELIMRETAREILEECGYEVAVAENGYNALEIFKEKSNEISAVVMDMAMPVMSGIVAYKEMLKIDPDVKVLITSGFKQDKRISEVIELGADGFIEKPYTLEKLGLTVKEIIMNDL
jgi:PAS domain S-box-containing protein